MSDNFGINRIVDWLQPRLTKAFSDTMAKWASRLLVFFLAWILGQRIWLFVETPVVSRVALVSTPINVSGSSPVSANKIEQLINFNLFGLYNAGIPVVESVTNAPRTSLNLTLVGLVANSAPARGLAVIANSGSQSIYGIGETITGTGVVLRQVMADRVILRNSGRDEALMLEGVDYTKGGQSLVTTEQQKSPSQSKNTDKADLSEIKTEILKKPQALLKFITLSQEREGKNIIGYRLGPGSDPRLFKQSGLKNGDVAVSINNIDLTNPSEMNKIWQSLSDASEIILTVRRNGQLHKIHIGL